MLLRLELDSGEQQPDNPNPIYMELVWGLVIVNISEVKNASSSLEYILQRRLL